MGLFDFLKTSKTRKVGGETPFLPTQVRSLLTGIGETRFESTWTNTPNTADSYVYRNWVKLVARSREQCENNDHARKFQMMIRDNVAGPSGFILNAQIKDPNGTPDVPASQAIEEAFAVQSESRNWDITGTLSRVDMERLAMKSLVTDGEAIAVIRYGSDCGEFGFSLQMIDPMLLNPIYFEKLPNGNFIRHSIEYNANNKPVAYHFRENDDRLESYVGYTSREKYNRIPSENVIHVFVSEMVSQKRGLPWMRTALGRMRMLSAFEDSAIINARIGACKMGFFRDPEADPSDGDPLPVEADAGTFMNIGQKEFVPFNPAFPDPFMGQFSQSILRSIASGLGISYNNLASDLTNVNFSSIRQGTLEDREFYKGLQNWFSNAWCLKIYEKWLEVGLLSGKITVAGRPLKMERRSKYMSVTFQGRRWAWIDPQAEVTANQMAISANLKSRSEVIRDNGGDPEDVFAEIKRENDLMEKLGVTPLPPAGSPVSVAMPTKEKTTPTP